MEPAMCASAPALGGNFLMLRTPVAIYGQTLRAESRNGFLYFSSDTPGLEISFHCLHRVLEEVLLKNGILGIENYWCQLKEQSPLFQLRAASPDDIRQVFDNKEKIARDLVAKVTEQLRKDVKFGGSSDPAPYVECEVELYVMVPNYLELSGEVIPVTEGNVRRCVDSCRQNGFLHFGHRFVELATPIEKRGPPVLGTLLTELKDVVEWFHFGIYLGIDASKLKLISVAHPTEPETCRIEMFMHWLQSYEATWLKVVEALHTVGHVTLAMRIARKYGLPTPSAKCVKPEHEMLEQNGLKNGLSELDGNKDMQAKIDKLSEEITIKDEALHEKQQALQKAESEKTNLQLELRGLKNKKNTLKERKAELKKKTKAIKRTLTEKEEELEALRRSAHEGTALQEIIATKEREYIEIKKQLKATEDKLQSERQMIVQLQQETATLQNNLILSEREIESLNMCAKREQELLGKIITYKEEEVAECKEELHKKENELAAQSKMTTELQEKFRVASTELASVSAEARILRKDKEKMSFELEREREHVNELQKEKSAGSEKNADFLKQMALQAEMNHRKQKSMELQQQLEQKKVELQQKAEIQQMANLIAQQEAELQDLREHQRKKGSDLDDEITDKFFELGDSKQKLLQLEEENEYAATKAKISQEKASIRENRVASMLKERRLHTLLQLVWCSQTPALCPLDRGAAVSDGRFAYFTPYSSNRVFRYSTSDDDWIELPAPCPNSDPGLAMIQGTLTSVGGWKEDGQSCFDNKLFSYTEGEWVEQYPAMQVARSSPAVVSDEQYVIAAGGLLGNKWTSAIEVFSVSEGVWSFTDLPEPLENITAVLCDHECLVMNDSGRTYSIPLQSLLQAQPFWKRLHDHPWGSPTLTSVYGRPITVGGQSKPNNTTTGDVYELSDDGWIKIGSMKVPRFRCLVCVVLGQELVVVGGRQTSPESPISLTDGVESAQLF